MTGSKSYCNMYDVTLDSFNSFIRGVVVKITPDVIEKFINVQRPQNPYYPLIPNSENVKKSPHYVVIALYGGPSEWHSDLLDQNELTDDYHLPNIFVSHNIKPRGHTFDLNCHQVYAIRTGIDVDIQKTNLMPRFVSMEEQSILPFRLVC